MHTPPGLRVERVRIDSLHQWPENANEGDAGAISESLAAHGLYMPVLVQESSRGIIKGNHTVQAAEILGWTEIDAVFIDVDDEEAERIGIGDNRYGRLARFKPDVLAEKLLTFQQETTKGLLGTGFDDDDLHELLARNTVPLDFEGADADTRRGHRVHRCPQCLHEWEGSCTPDD